MVLNIGTININGFRSKRKQLYIKDILTKENIDILFIQETFVENFFLSKRIEQFININRLFIWNYGANNSRGTLIIVNNKDINVDNYHCDHNGRIIYADIHYSENNYRVINTYFPNDSNERNNFIHDLNRYLVTSRHVILGGDFNFVMNISLDKIGGNQDKGNIGSKHFQNVIISSI